MKKNGSFLTKTLFYIIDLQINWYVSQKTVHLWTQAHLYPKSKKLTGLQLHACCRLLQSQKRKLYAASNSTTSTVYWPKGHNYGSPDFMARLVCSWLTKCWHVISAHCRLTQALASSSCCVRLVRDILHNRTFPGLVVIIPQLTLMSVLRTCSHVYRWSFLFICFCLHSTLYLWKNSGYVHLDG